jgi:hypothetical protein
MDGQTKQVLLAAGAAELLMRIPIDREYREAIWDQAAGSLLVEEAGGRVTDLDGMPLDFTTGRHLLRNTGRVVSNALLYDAVLDVLRQRSVGEGPKAPRAANVRSEDWRRSSRKSFCATPRIPHGHRVSESTNRITD